MKVAFTDPVDGEVYVASKRDVTRVVKSLCPHLQLVAFQTMHTPRMSRSIPYLATFSHRYVRILSISSEMATEAMREAFMTTALPHICRRVQFFVDSSHFWPCVVVSIAHSIHEVSCMEGALFPNAKEIDSMIHRSTSLVCKY